MPRRHKAQSHGYLVEKVHRSGESHLKQVTDSAGSDPSWMSLSSSSCMKFFEEIYSQADEDTAGTTWRL